MYGLITEVVNPQNPSCSSAQCPSTVFVFAPVQLLSLFFFFSRVDVSLRISADNEATG